MKVFISWSGKRSHAVAEVLKDWVSSVIQAAKPWLSSADIQRGAQWMGDIGTHLNESTVGIFCLTNNNKDAPWILFEAGAVAKGVSSNRICTLLIDLEPTSVLGPLAQFNHTKPSKTDMLKLASTLNFALGENRLTDVQLSRSFEAHWEQFESDFQKAIEQNPEVQGPSPKPNTDDLLYEILSTVRSLGNRLNHLEEKSSKNIDLNHVFPFPSQEGIVSTSQSATELNWEKLAELAKNAQARHNLNIVLQEKNKQSKKN